MAAFPPVPATWTVFRAAAPIAVEAVCRTERASCAAAVPTISASMAQTAAHLRDMKHLTCLRPVHDKTSAASGDMKNGVTRLAGSDRFPGRLTFVRPYVAVRPKEGDLP